MIVPLDRKSKRVFIMVGKIAKLTFIVVVLFLAGAVQAVVFGDFEPPTYTEGALGGQDGWLLKKGSSSASGVTAVSPLAGTQSAYVTGTTSSNHIGKPFAGSGVTELPDGTAISMLLRPDAETTDCWIVLSSNMSTAGVFFRVYQASGQAARIECYEGGWQDAGLPAFENQDTYKLELQLNFASNYITVYGTNITQGGEQVQGSVLTELPYEPAALLASGGILIQGGNVTFDDFVVGGDTTCAMLIAAGQQLPMDFDGDCYVDFLDFAIMVKDWMYCFDPEDETCEKPWLP